MVKIYWYWWARKTCHETYLLVVGEEENLFFTSNRSLNPLRAVSAWMYLLNTAAECSLPHPHGADWCVFLQLFHLFRVSHLVSKETDSFETWQFVVHDLWRVDDPRQGWAKWHLKPTHPPLETIASWVTLPYVWVRAMFQQTAQTLCLAVFGSQMNGDDGLHLLRGEKTKVHFK